MSSVAAPARARNALGLLVSVVGSILLPVPLEPVQDADGVAVGDDNAGRREEPHDHCRDGPRYDLSPATAERQQAVAPENA